jgi:hypothetical protein
VSALPARERQPKGWQAGAEWAQIEATAPRVAAVMRRYLRQLSTFLAPRSVDAALAPATVHGDARLAGRLVANLADNAIRYNIPGGRVEIVTALKAGRPVLLVANTGPRYPTARSSSSSSPSTGSPPAEQASRTGTAWACPSPGPSQRRTTPPSRPARGPAAASPSRSPSPHPQHPAAVPATARYQPHRQPPHPGPVPLLDRACNPRREPSERPAEFSPKAQVARQALVAGGGAPASRTVIVGQVGFSGVVAA